MSILRDESEKAKIDTKKHASVKCSVIRELVGANFVRPQAVTDRPYKNVILYQSRF